MHQSNALTKYGNFYKLRVDVTLKGDKSIPIYSEMFALLRASMEAYPAVQIRVFTRAEEFVLEDKSSDVTHETFYLNITVPVGSDAEEEVNKVAGIVFYSFHQYHANRVENVRCRTVTLDETSMMEKFSAEIAYNYTPDTGFLGKLDRRRIK